MAKTSPRVFLSTLSTVCVCFIPRSRLFIVLSTLVSFPFSLFPTSLLSRQVLDTVIPVFLSLVSFLRPQDQSLQEKEKQRSPCLCSWQHLLPSATGSSLVSSFFTYLMRIFPLIRLPFPLPQSPFPANFTEEIVYTLYMSMIVFLSGRFQLPYYEPPRKIYLEIHFLKEYNSFRDIYS